MVKPIPTSKKSVLRVRLPAHNGEVDRGRPGGELLSAIVVSFFIAALVAEFASGWGTDSLLIVACWPVGAIATEVPSVAVLPPAVSKSHVFLLRGLRYSESNQTGGACQGTFRVQFLMRQLVRNGELDWGRPGHELP